MQKRKKRVALIIDYIVTDYSKALVQGVRKACERLDFDLIIFPIGLLNNLFAAYEYQRVAITAFVTKHNIDGIIFTSGTQMHHLTKDELGAFLRSYKSLPIVNISSDFPGIHSVCVDNFNAYDAIFHELIEHQNCKRFGIITVNTNSAEVKNRIDSIKAVLAKYKISSENVNFWEGNFEYGMAYSCLEEYYNQNGKFDFDAVIALNDEMAIAAEDFCHNHKIKVPKEVAVVGFDNIPRGKYSNPPISTIDHEISYQGEKACEMLAALIKGKHVEKIQTISATAVFRLSSEKTKYSTELMKNKTVLVEKRTRRQDSYNKTIADWDEQKNLFFQVTNFYTELQTDTTLKQLQVRLNTDLKRFSVTGCAIVVYNSPIEKNAPFDYFNLPHSARVISAFDYGTGVDDNGIENPVIFDPNETILPDGILKHDSYGFIALALYHNNLQYGYMLLRTGAYDVCVYDFLTKVLSAVIATVYSNSLAFNEKSIIEKQKRKLDIVASTDELTGLFNRRGLYSAGNKALEYAEEVLQSGLIIYSDMDGLKKINDTFGHEAGDKAILAESIILKGNFRTNDIIARIGGDEFAMVCPCLTETVFDKIRAQIDKDCQTWTETSNAGFKLSISMGFIKYPGDRAGYQLAKLLSEADSKLYEEKKIKHQKLAEENKSSYQSL